MSLDIDPTAYTMTVSGITVAGTGIDGQVVRLYLDDTLIANDSGAMTCTVDEKVWAIGPFSPPGWAGVTRTYSARAEVVGGGGKDHVEDITVTASGPVVDPGGPPP